ncbi:unnamed protein product [Brugia pahangi]|uniref:Uncharacterized protein n=1 Tax=Brugia pahangi TaxID=6280 RepID=A0A0N4TIG7_BRUPA|nr:unnamed protein product [Brugia pahangi]
MACDYIIFKTTAWGALWFKIPPVVFYMQLYRTLPNSLTDHALVAKLSDWIGCRSEDSETERGGADNAKRGRRNASGHVAFPSYIWQWKEESGGEVDPTGK